MDETRYQNADRRAREWNARIVERARKLSVEAGLDPELLGIHPHNAMCSYRQGKPWPDVDYSKVRRILWLLDKVQWRASNFVDLWVAAVHARMGNYEAYLYLHKEVKCPRK